MNLLLRSFIAFAALIALPSNSSAASVSFDLTKAGSNLQPRHLAGTCLPIWNNATTYNQIKTGLAQSNYRLFRFPNGSLSNGYHWNGTGSYTADSIWVCDSLSCTPGFMSMTLRRGTSVSNWGFASCSKITDGDTATYWRSDELIAESSPYCYLELPKAVTVDSIVIMWGGRYAVDFSVDFYTKTTCPYPGPFGYSDDLWKNLKSVAANNQPVSALNLQDTAATRYVRIYVTKFKDTEKSVEIREVYLFAKGVQISKNVNNFTGGGKDDQTMVIAMPTFIGNTLRPGTLSWKSWHFESFMTYIKSISDSSIPVICVNYSTGTPEEAAAWVYYANIAKKYNVKYWQIGNELDGAWEDGGPVSPVIYAEKFLRFSKAMKKIDPSIKIFGPLLSNAYFDDATDGISEARSWIKPFLDIVGKAEKTDNQKYCDGIDFHSYPYWDYTMNSAGMLKTVDDLYSKLDNLKRWRDSSLVAPESVFVMMSEFNSMSSNSSLLMTPLNGIYVANMYAGLAEKFGSRAMSVFWDSFEEGDIGYDDTFGSMSLFNNPDSEFKSSLTKVPSAAYWTLYATQNLWIDPQKDNSIVHATIDSAPDIRAYGIKTADNFRALMFNFALTPQTISCSPSGIEYDSVDVFTWGETQFKWFGSDKYAFAYPNCGPNSKTFSKNDAKSITIPGLSMAVVWYRGSISTAKRPQFLHLLSKPYAGMELIIPICGSVFGGGSTITGITYAVDNAADFTKPIRSLDGGFDGPFESFFDTISVKSLASGPHRLYIQVKNGSGETTIDSVAFSVSSMSAKNPRPANLAGDGEIAEKKSIGRIRISIDSPVLASRQEPVKARIFSLNGACVKVLSGSDNGRTVFEWAGETMASRKAAPGIYFIVVSAGPKTVYRTTVMMGN